MASTAPLPPQARFRARPEASRTDTRLIDTGNLNNPGKIDRWGLEGAWIHGPFLVQGEYLDFRRIAAGQARFKATATTSSAPG